jgi:hypothetical protein
MIAHVMGSLRAAVEVPIQIASFYEQVLRTFRLFTERHNVGALGRLGEILRLIEIVFQREALVMGDARGVHHVARFVLRDVGSRNVVESFIGRLISVVVS